MLSPAARLVSSCNLHVERCRDVRVSCVTGSGAGLSVLSVAGNGNFEIPVTFQSRSQWPRGLRRRSAAACLLRSWVRIPPGAWMFVCCDCCVLSGRGLCDGLITRPEESYRLCCVVVCDLETSRMGAPYIYDIRRLRIKFTFILKVDHI